MWTAANGASLARIAAIPVVLILLAVPGPAARLAAAVVFSAAALSDALDGYLARRQANTSVLGSLLDQTADKLLVATVLVELVARQQAASWVASVVIGRELLVSGVRTFAASRGLVIPAGPLGKLKTALTCVAIVFAILEIPWTSELLVITAALTILSAWPYLRSAARLMVAATLPGP